MWGSRELCRPSDCKGKLPQCVCDTPRPRVQHLFRESANTSITHWGDYKALCGSEVVDTHLGVCVMHNKWNGLTVFHPYLV